MIVASLLTTILLAANQVGAASIADSTADADEISSAHIKGREIRKRSPETSDPAQQGEDVYDHGVYSGTKSVRGQIPWQALIIMDDILYCGGSLISTTDILTAGHCVKGFESFKVTLGLTNRDVKQENSVTQTSRTGIVHEDYDYARKENNGAIKNDVAIIKIEEVEESSYIQIIQLPKSSQVVTTFEGEEARVSGFGYVAGKYTSSELVYADVKVVSNKKCKKYHGRTLKHTNICTVGTGARKPCRGDDGGPLTLVDDGTDIQIGIVSFYFFSSASICLPKLPAVYTRTTSFLKWISVNADVPIRE